jgi:hypothetical protein
MVGRTLDWQDELERWLKPFLDRLGHKATAPDVSALRVGAHRPWRSQEHSADGEATCARRM